MDGAPQIFIERMNGYGTIITLNIRFRATVYKWI